MVEEQSWRELLGEIISDVHERQRIADSVGINPVTLIRWTSGKSNPRQDNLRPLLDTLPQYRTQLTRLISKEFPTLLLLSAEEQENLQEIPATFYAHVLETYTSNPVQLRTSTVGELILQQMLNHLDPHRLGMAIIIAKCTKPVPGRKVRSLLQALGRGTDPWNVLHDHHIRFYGAESQVGHALMRGYPIVLQNRLERMRLFPVHVDFHEQSAAAYPILLGERTAGCIAIVSTQTNYFTPTHINLIADYVALLVLAFEQHEFYDLQSIELGVMPAFEQQALILAHFQQRVTQRMIEALQQHRQVTRPEAERIIWQEYEEKLLCQVYDLESS